MCIFFIVVVSILGLVFRLIIISLFVICFRFGMFFGLVLICNIVRYSVVLCFIGLLMNIVFGLVVSLVYCGNML